MDARQIERFLQNDASASEARVVARYLLENPVALEEHLPESAWEQSNSRLWLKEKVSRRMLRHIKCEAGMKGRKYGNLYKAAVAASLVLGLFLVGQLYLGRKNAEAPVSASPAITMDVFAVKTNHSLQPQAIVLEDGSEVELMPGAEITYPQPFLQEDRRTVYLKGEALFKVAKDSRRPFTVQAGGLATTALGTSFRVKATAGGKSVQVQLYTGKVLVKPASEALQQKVKEVYLNPGQQLDLDKENPEGRVSNIIARKERSERKPVRPVVEEGSMTIDGDMIEFSKRPLPVVLDELSKVHGRDIRYRLVDIARISFTGRISTTDSLEQVLQTIAVLNDLKMEKEQDSYYIRK